MIIAPIDLADATDFDLATGDELPREAWTWISEFNTWHHLLHVLTAPMLLVAALRRAWAPIGAPAFGAIYVVLTPAGSPAGSPATAPPTDSYYGTLRSATLRYDASSNESRAVRGS